MRPLLTLACALALALLLLAAEAPPPTAAVALSVDPAYRRVELPADGVTTAVVTVRSDRAAMLLAGTSECPCVSLATAMPLALPAGQAVPVTLRVSGLLTGVKTVALRTTVGVIEVRVQVVSQGRGNGASVWAELLREAQANGWSVTVLVHDLRGAVRNCGCSGGSLGGIDLLAGLGGAVRRAPAGPLVRLVLSGDVDAQRDGVGAALATYGWEVRPADVVERAQATDIATVGAGVIVVTPDLTGPEHARLVRAPPAQGLAAVVLLRDSNGAVRQRHLLPIDRTLPQDVAILARFPDRLTGTLIVDAPVDAACATCHPAAQAVWAASRHAHALDSLPIADRTDGCIGCHATDAASALPPRWIGGVGCTTCHQGTAAHLATSGATRTTGTVACSQCHDAKHHPAFDRAAGWAVVGHGKDLP